MYGIAYHCCMTPHCIIPVSRELKRLCVEFHELSLTFEKDSVNI